MDASTLHSSDNLNDILGFSPGFIKYLDELLSGMCLESKFIKDSGMPHRKVTISLTFSVGGKTTIGGSRRRQPLAGKASSPETTRKPHTPKKKTPSRIRRDRERFRQFVEKKKLNKKSVSKPRSQSKPDFPVQCQPPPDIEISLPRPSSVTLASQTTVKLPPKPETAPPRTCVCDVCRTFVDKLPFKEELYRECHNCGKPNSEDAPLKPCAKCLGRAYCSKECQREAWKGVHKGECDKTLGDQIRGVRESWYLCREVWLEHQGQLQPSPI